MRTLRSFLVALLLAFAAVHSNAALTPGNIVVCRVGTGSAPLTTAATEVFLDEYTADGTFVQTIALPTAVVGGQRRLTASGTGGEGLLTRSLDRRYLVLGGYDAAVGTADVAATSISSVNRVIGRVDPTGAIDTSTALGNAISSGAIRSVASTNGLQFWLGGSAGGARYVATLGANASIQVNTFSNPISDLRHVALFENELYASTQSGSSYRIARIGGTSPPTSIGWFSTPLPGFPVSSGAPEGFFFVDLNGNGAKDTLYVADSVAGIQKWSLVGGAWVARGALSLAGAVGLSAVVSGGMATLFVTNGSSLSRVTDAGGFNATITGTITTIVSAAANTSLRGVANAPVPPPPAVTSIVGTPPLGRANGPVDYTVTFDRPVTGVDATDFSVAASGLTASVASVSGSGTTYLVSIATAGEGNLRLFVRDDDTITDGIEPLGGAGAGNGDAGTNDSFVISPPTVVSSIALADANPTTATTVHFTISFSRSVSFVDASDFAVVSTGAIHGSIATISAGPAFTYTITVNTGGSGAAGTVRLDFVDHDDVFDSQGHPVGGVGEGNGNFTGPVYTIERVPHVVSVVRGQGSPSFQTPLPFVVTFDAPVSGVDVTDFAASATGTVVPSIAGVSGTGSVYVVNLSTGGPGVSGSVRLDFVDDDSVLDGATPVGGAGAGNGNVTGPSYDVVAGAVVLSIVRAGDSPTSMATVDFTLTFSNPVTGVDPSDFTVATSGLTAASVSAVNGGPAIYTVTVASGVGVGTLRLDLVDDDSIRADGIPLNGPGSHNGDFVTGEAYQIERDPPRVVAIRRGYASPTSSTILGFSIEFDTFVRGIDATDFAITTTGTIFGTGILIPPGPEGIATGMTVTYLGGEGTLRLDVVEGATITGPNGVALQSGFTSGESYVVDRPMVRSIVRAGMDPTGAESVTWTVTFSEPMSGVDVSDFELFQLSGASITDVAGGGLTYTVTASTGPNSGELELTLNDDDSIVDGTGTPLGGPGAVNGSFFSGEHFHIDHRPPFVGSIVRASANPATGSSVDYVVSFGEDVTGVDPSDFVVVMSGVTGALVTSVTGNGRVYRVIVATGAGAGTLQLRFVDDDSITDAVGNPLDGVGASDPIDGAPYWVNGALPDAPTELRAAVSDSAVELTWVPNPGSGASSLRRSTAGGGPYVEIARSGTSYFDTAVVNATTYYYVVRALDPESEDSSEVAATPNAPQALGVVISQIYGGGGENGAMYRYDYVELFNRGSQSVALWGWNVESLSPAAPGWQRTPLAGLIEPGHYYLVQEAEGIGGTSDLPNPDRTGFIDIAAEGVIALVGSNEIVSGCSHGAIADLVGYGASASCFEGARTLVQSNPNALFRSNGGCVDSNDNASDFESSAPSPRNSTRPAYPCGPSIPPNGVGAANPSSVLRGGNSRLTVTVLPGQNPASTAVFVAADLSSIGGSATQALFDDGTNGDVVPADLVYSYGATVASSTPIGTRTVACTISDERGRSSSAAINLDVRALPVPPVPLHLVATPGDAQVLLEWDSSAGANSYRIKRSTASGGPYATIAVDITQMRYTDASVTNGIRYYYVVSARSGETESADSEEATARPEGPPPAPRATHFAINAPPNVGRGVPFNMLVTALDAASSVVTSYSGTVHFTSASDGVLPADAAFVPADHGSHTFTVVLTTAGATSVLVSDGSIMGTALVVVDCGTSVVTLPIVLAASVCPMSADHSATVEPVTGATSYDWTILNGTITQGQGTPTIRFTAGSATSVSLQVSVAGGACPLARGEGNAVIVARPTAILSASMNVCPGERVDITAHLAGTAPFDIVWSDGRRQSTTTKEAHRFVNVDGVGTIRVESVRDAFCESDGPSNRMTFVVGRATVIASQPQSTTVRRGETTTLSVDASGDALAFEWFQGEEGDTRQAVGTNAPALATPAIEATTKFWVRASGSCGQVDSQAATISVQSKRRSTRS